MAVTSLSTWDGMRNYILTKLGAPVINIEISEEQLNLVIEDTIRDFWYYNTDRGNYMDYIVFQTSACVSEYPVSSVIDYRTSAVIDDIEAVYDFSVREGLDGLNTLFSPQHILLYDQFVTNGAYPGGPVDSNGPGLTLTNFYSSMMYIDSIREAFGKYYTASYIPGKRVIKIVPTPVDYVMGVLIVYRRQLAENLFNDNLFRKLIVARGKIQWGQHLRKYSGSMPDGFSINGDAILSEGREDEEKYLDWLRKEAKPADFFVA